MKLFAACAAADAYAYAYAYGYRSENAAARRTAAAALETVGRAVQAGKSNASAARDVGGRGARARHDTGEDSPAASGSRRRASPRIRRGQTRGARAFGAGM